MQVSARRGTSSWAILTNSWVGSMAVVSTCPASANKRQESSLGRCSVGTVWISISALAWHWADYRPHFDLAADLVPVGLEEANY